MMKVTGQFAELGSTIRVRGSDSRYSLQKEKQGIALLFFWANNVQANPPQTLLQFRMNSRNTLDRTIDSMYNIIG